MFIQPCFIKKNENTFKILEKLKELGYKEGVSPHDKGDKFDRDIHLFEDKYHFRTNVCYGITNVIDCDEDEELFISLAALRDDTPLYSWYWFNDKLVICYSIFDLNVNTGITYRFELADNPKIRFPADIQTMRKATVEDIVEFFKNKKS